MPEDRDALLRHYRQMRQELLAVIDGLGDEAMTDPSLDGWTIKDHLAHIALWDDIRAGEVARISAGHDSAWRMTPEHEAAFSPLASALRTALPLDQARWELATSMQRLLDAIASATTRGLDGSLYDEAGLRSTHEAVHTGWITRWRESRASSASTRRSATHALPPSPMATTYRSSAMTDRQPVFDQFNLVVRDMEATVAFYRRLGLTIPDTSPEWDRHRSAVMPDGIDLDFDQVDFARQWNRGWNGAPGSMGVLGFRLASRDAVDRLFEELTAAGYQAQQPPYDAFWGARYAIISDPDGNAVGLMSPVDPARRSPAPTL